PTATSSSGKPRNGRIDSLRHAGALEHTPSPNEMRDHLANVRTFLAWVRTAITIMAFGFVVARFGLLLRELPGASSHVGSVHFSSFIGVALVGMGAMFLILAIVNFLAVRRQIEQQKVVLSVGIPIFLAGMLTFMAVALALYLAVTA
ncbi:MAG: DUF202 domain-containing protein, partial [Chloroflexi bacterium]|nr:DUF202 domain-containing protein [Chloroflexota bacterium]